MNIFERIKNYFIEELPFFFAMPAVLWEILFFCIPLVCIIAISFIKDWDVSIFSGFTFKHYLQLFEPIYLKIIVRSFLLAIWTSFLCLMFGYPLAYYLACKASRTIRNTLLFFLILPFWTNFLILIYAWYFVLEKHGLINDVLMGIGIIKTPFIMLNTLFAISIVMFYCYLPFMILPIYVVLEKLDKTLIDASQDLGATMRQTFFKVILPLSIPGIITGVLLVFVPAFGEFAIPLFIGGDKYMLTGSLIEHYFLVARNSSMGAAVTCLSCLLLFGAIFFLQWSLKKKFPNIVKVGIND